MTKIERTSAWAVAVVLVAGCTNNTISLNDDSGSGTEGTDGTGGTDGTDGTETSPDSGSDDGPPPECVVDWDCGDCGWCSAGVCQEDVGCCSGTPEQPWVWHCSPPWDCFDDSECPDGQVCTSEGYCEPDPNEIQEPPACRGDLALSVAELPLDVGLVQIAVTDGGLWAIGEDLQVRPVSFDVGLGDPVGVIGGEQALELLPIDASTLVAVGVGTSIEGDLVHQLARIHDPGDGSWGVALGELQLAPAAAATWLQDPAEVIVGTEGQLARWTADLQSAGPNSVLDAGALALTRLPFGGGSSLAAVARDDGAVELWDITADAILADGHVLHGRPVDMAYAAETGGGEPRLFAVSHVEPDPADLFPKDMAAVELIRIDAPLTATNPFGASGIPVATAVTDLDGNGIDDVLVANADGRLDLYLMEAEGPRCRAFLPLSPILELETGDVNGDGLADVLVLDAGPSLMAIHGAG